MQITRAQKEFVKILKYHDLYVQSDTFLLTDVFENFRNMNLEMYELDPAKFLLVPGYDIDMLLMLEKGIRGVICHSIYQYAKANSKYMKDYEKK